MKYIFFLQFFFLSFVLQAATSGSLILKGIIPEMLEITITPNTTASALDLTVNQKNILVASVQEKSNSPTGYKITITTQNLGKLINGSEVFAYSLRYGNTRLDLSGPHTITHTLGTVVNKTEGLRISYKGIPADQLLAGSYSEVVTLSISAN